MIIIEFLLNIGLQETAERIRLITRNVIVLTMFLYLIIMSRTRTTRSIRNTVLVLILFRFLCDYEMEFITKCAQEKNAMTQ